MGSTITKKFTGFLVITFILWYLLRRTELGSAYVGDMFAIPRFFGAGEGLNSAGRYIGR